MTLLLVLITLLLVAACVFVAEKRIVPLRYRDATIPEFSVPFSAARHAAPTMVVDTVDGDDAYDCNAKSLRVCRLDDVTTLMGCRELTARCYHFDRDTEFHERGDVTVIPRNASPAEGYALAIGTMAETCNPFHGDPVLISGALESTGYVLGCLCKNPGYVGSENVLDPCTTVHICGGRVDSVDKPLSEINCVCDATETSVRYEDGLPSCRPLTVDEANRKFDDWSHVVPWSSDRLIDKRVFNATVRDNMKTGRLLDPCANALTDAAQPIPGGRYDAQLKTCTYTDYGLPVVTGVLDGVGTVLDGALPSGRHRYLRLIDNVGGKRRIVNVRTEVYFDPATGRPGGGKTVPVNVTLPAPTGVGGVAQLSLTTADQMLGGRCEGSWPRYTCRVTEYYDRKVFGVPTAGYRAAPGAFLWATDGWENAERMVSSGVIVDRTGVSLDNERLNAIHGMRYYGLKLCHADTADCENGILSFDDEDDYRRHSAVLT